MAVVIGELPPAGAVGGLPPAGAIGQLPPAGANLRLEAPTSHQQLLQP